jgi:hypothetical protein
LPHNRDNRVKTKRFSPPPFRPKSAKIEGIPQHSLLKNCDGLGASKIVPGFELRVPAIRSHEFNLASVSEAI